MKKKEKYNLLYVDDEESNLHVFNSILRRKFAIKTAQTAREGLQLFSENTFDIVIADQRMPEIDGLEFLGSIKEQKPLIPTILLTGYTDYEVLKKAFNEVGVHKYVNKPFDPESLSTMIELAVEAYHLNLENEQMQQSLQESERKFREIFNSMADVFIRVNRENKIVIVSPSVEELTGYAPHELMEKDASLLYFNPGDRDRFLENIKNKQVYKGAEATLKTKSGKKKYVSSNSKAFFDEKGEFKYVESIVRDISDRKKIDLALRELNEKLEEKVNERTKELEKAKKELEVAYQKEKELGKLKSQFVATASHQFRTPLTVIQANIGLLEMQFEKIDPIYKAKFDKAYKRIQSEVKRMTSLMDNVLILGKKDVGAIKVDLQMVDILPLIKDIVNKYNEIQEDQRKMEIKVSGTVFPFLLDIKLFEHAFSNLVSNAFKYSKNKPAPRVQLNFGKKELILMVEDFGVGIPEEDQEHIFEPFYRASNVKDISGTGLGTAITNEYLQLMGAKVEMKSKLQEGTQFIIRLKK